MRRLVPSVRRLAVCLALCALPLWGQSNPTIAPSSLSNGILGAAYSQTLTASGGYGAGTYSFFQDSESGGTLPPGVQLSAGGTLLGTPTATGTYSFTAQVASTSTNPSGNSPTLYGSQPYTVVVYPNLAVNTEVAGSGTVGVPYSQAFTASGGAGSSTYTWSVITGTPPPGLTFSVAGTLSGTPTTSGNFVFTVQVSSQVPNYGALTANATYNVGIAQGPLLITGSLGNGIVGVPYSATLVATGGAPPYAWSVYSGSLPGGLSFNTASATLSGTPTTLGSFSFVISVSDAADHVYTTPFTVNIGAPLVITTQAPLAAGVQGLAYSQSFAATGGTAPYQWSIDTPPPGLAIGSSSGTLSGTPSASGTFNFNVKVADGSSFNVTKAFTVLVYPSLVITLAAASSGTVGVPYSQTFTASGGGGSSTYTWSWAGGTLPPGLTFSAAGVLGGTPTTSGNFVFTVQVSSQVPAIGAVTAAAQYSMAIFLPPLAITGSLGNGALGVPYSATLAATGGTPPYQWSIDALPPGLAMGSSSGTLSGTPSITGTFNFNVKVADSASLVATKAFTIVVGVPPAPAITISGLPSTPTPATQPVLGLSVSGSYPLAVQGTITLVFAPDSGPDDPNVLFTTGGRTVTFQIPAGSTQAQFPGNAPGVQTGTVAGTITLTLRLTAGGIDITPAPAPTQVLRVTASPPAITSAAITLTSAGFNLVVVGYSTPRDMLSAAVTFNPAAGVTLTGNNVTVSLSQVFTTWYAGSASAQFGSAFSLQIPFTIQGGTNPLTSLSVVIANSQGASAAATVTF